MCFGGGGDNSPEPTPAPAPPPAEPAPQETEIGAERNKQEQTVFGNKQLGDFTRVDRSLTPPSGGSGLKM